MEKINLFEGHDDLVVAIIIDPSLLYVRTNLNLLHCSIHTRPY